jgi:SAM-dependent methyltransferase
MPSIWLTYARERELARAKIFLPTRGRLLDFGAGSGHQARLLQEWGFEVDAIDVAGSAHLDRATFPVRTYDGRLLPYPDDCFDGVLSSNVLEHVAGLRTTLRELARVSKPGAPMVHIIPTATWRLWTSLAEFVAAPRNMIRGLRSAPDLKREGMSLRNWKLLQLTWPIRPFLFRPHGEGGCALTELWTFRSAVWQRRFREAGYEVIRVEPLAFWYTGESLLGHRLAPLWRERMSAWLGSAAMLYVTRVRGSARQ